MQAQGKARHCLVGCETESSTGYVALLFFSPSLPSSFLLHLELC
jgi:hypothetical protein